MTYCVRANLTACGSLSVALVACAAASMHAPADVSANSELLQVDDRMGWGVTSERESFSFGPYRVQDVKRRPVEAAGYSVLGFGNRRLTTGFSYAVTREQRRDEASCELAQTGNDTALAGKLACRCADASLLLEVGRDAQGGTLSLAGQSYRAQALRERESGEQSNEPLGYRFDIQQRPPLAALELGHPGRVWLQRTLEPASRDALACLLAGALLYRPITIDPHPR